MESGHLNLLFRRLVMKNGDAKNGARVVIVGLIKAS